MKRTKNFLYLFGVFLIAVLLLIVLLYRFSTKELSKSYTSAAKNQLNYASNNLAAKTKEIEFLATSLMADETIRFFANKIETQDLDEYEYVQAIKKIDARLTQAESNSIGIESVQVYWPKPDYTISSKIIVETNKKLWIKELRQKGRAWNNLGNVVYFSTSYPYIDYNDTPPEYFVVIEMKESYLKEIEQVITNLDKSEALIRLPNGDFFSGSAEVNPKISKQLTLETQEVDLEMDQLKVKVLANYLPMNQMQLISYFDMGAFMGPVAKISGLTLFSTFTVLLIGLLLMYLFYRYFLFQLDLLIQKFQRVENGDLTTKIIHTSTNEFNYVFEQFNQMVSGVDRLLLSLNNEYQRHDLAERKQLQAQINPHFFYNSLFYIISVAENPAAVKAMSTHLAEYYQYRTGTSDLVLLEDEVNFSRSYLSIMAMRKLLVYHIEIDEGLIDEMILPLLIQPLLENAIEHGIEEKEGAGRVNLMIKGDEERFVVCVEDDGHGLSPESLRQLHQDINRHHEGDRVAVGLWNVNQRLLNYYGPEAGIKLEKSQKLGGLKISFTVQGGGD